MAVFRSKASYSPSGGGQTSGAGYILADVAKTITGVNTIGDYVLFRNVPRNSLIVNYTLGIGDADSNGTPLISHDFVLTKVGNGGVAGSDITIASGITTGRTGGIFRPLTGAEMFEKVTGEDYQFALKLGAAAATAQSYDAYIAVEVVTGDVLQNETF
jgi:hypothetical protein